MDPRFADLAGCIEAIRPALESLADTAQRVRPNKDNLFVSVIYDRAMWERVQDHIARWGRKQMHEHRLRTGARPKDAFDRATAMPIKEPPRYSTIPAAGS